MKYPINPDDINLTNPSQEFEFVKISREIDACDDVDELRNMCKFLVKLEMQSRANYSIMLQDLLSDLTNK